MKAKRSKPYTAFVEACYAEAASDGAWLRGIGDVLGPVFGSSGAGICLSREVDREVLAHDNRGSAEAVLNEAVRQMPALSDATYQAIWRPSSPVIVYSRWGLEHVPAPQRALLMEQIASAEVGDVIGLLGEPQPGLLFSLVVFLRSRIDSRGRGRLSELQRLRLHLDAGLRLRHTAGRIVARISPNGKIIHANGEGTTNALRAALSADAAAIEFARHNTQATDGPEALLLWRALTAGRFSLVPRVESDGKPYYAAIENPPYATAFRALTEVETRVVELTRQRLPGKHVAYALGLSAGHVSECLSLAAQKLGCRSSTDMLRISAQLMTREESALDLDCLSVSERAVFMLAREGHSNAEIASIRGTSIRTVCNQITTVLRKTGVASRRGLAI